MKRYKGFTIVEVVISAALVATTLGALFAVASMTIRLTTLGQDRLIASQLAREGLEVARQIRDTNFVSSSCSDSHPCANWWSGLSDTFPQQSQLLVLRQDDAVGFALGSASAGVNGCYGEVIERPLPRGAIQIFCRRIFLEPVANSQETADLDESQHMIRVRSQVAWLSYARKTFRVFGFNNLEPQNTCPAPVAATEWCTEQVTVVSDWRPTL